VASFAPAVWDIVEEPRRRGTVIHEIGSSASVVCTAPAVRIGCYTPGVSFVEFFSGAAFVGVIVKSRGAGW
jgi:hypothetical protein